MGPDSLAIICIFGIPLSIPLVSIWTKHQRQMLELKLQMRQQGNGNGQGEVEALRQEIRALRETSMQYDLSFDAALQRMEQRVARMEQNAQNAAYRPTYEASEPVANVRNGN